MTVHANVRYKVHQTVRGVGLSAGKGGLITTEDGNEVVGQVADVAWDGEDLLITIELKEKP